MNLYRLINYCLYLSREIQKLNKELDILYNKTYDVRKHITTLQIIRTNRIKKLGKYFDKCQCYYHKMNNLQLELFAILNNRAIVLELIDNGII